jgi:hypothetical protein
MRKEKKEWTQNIQRRVTCLSGAQNEKVSEK